MEPTIYKPSIYNGAGIYKTGAEGGGGGGGGDLPEGYKQCSFLEFVGNTQNIVFSGTKDLGLKSTDTLIIEGEAAGDSSGWTYDLIFIIFQYSQSNRGYYYRYNQNENRTLFDGLAQRVDFNNQHVTYFVLKKTNNDVLDVNGTTVSGDSWASGDTIPIKVIFENGNGRYTGTKIRYMKFLEKDTNKVKANFIPVIKNSTQHILYESISGWEIPLDTSHFMCKYPI